MMITDVTHIFLKELSLEKMSVPSWIYLAMCLSDASMVMWGFLQVDF